MMTTASQPQLPAKRKINEQCCRGGTQTKHETAGSPSKNLKSLPKIYMGNLDLKRETLGRATADSKT